MGTPITCLLVDDHPSIVAALELLLEADGIVVAGHASSGADAIAFADAAATVIVTDHSLPDMSGLEVASAILARQPEQKIILYRSTLTARDAERALAMGIRGVVLTESLATDLPAVVRLVAGGGTHVDPALG